MALVKVDHLIPDLRRVVAILIRSSLKLMAAFHVSSYFWQLALCKRNQSKCVIVLEL